MLRVWATKILETERDTLSISKEHEPIAAAIAAGDTEAARYEMEKHMRGAGARLRRVLNPLWGTAHPPEATDLSFKILDGELNRPGIQLLRFCIGFAKCRFLLLLRRGRSRSAVLFASFPFTP